MSLERRFGEENRESIKSWFHVTSTPDGEAPLLIRDQWVGVPLPLRYDKPMEAPQWDVAEAIYTREPVYIADHIKIFPFDAVKSLRLFGRGEAAEFWLDFSVMSGVKDLVFSMENGEWLPNELILRMFPQVANFDQQ